jgi:hypothetical protein
MRLQGRKIVYFRPGTRETRYMPPVVLIPAQKPEQNRGNIHVVPKTGGKKKSR